MPTRMQTLFTMVLRALPPALLAVATVLGGCEDDARTLVFPPMDTTTGPGMTGSSLYRYHCAGCHGLDGRPQVSSSSDLRDYSAPLDSFNLVLNDGPGLMPRYPDLDSAQRRLLYDHVGTFER